MRSRLAILVLRFELVGTTFLDLKLEVAIPVMFWSHRFKNRMTTGALETRKARKDSRTGHGLD